MLSDPSGLVRRQVLTTLVARKAAPGEMVPMLIRWLGDGASSARLDAAQSLGAYGGAASAAAAALRIATSDSEPEVAAAAATSLAAIDPANAVELLPSFVARLDAAAAIVLPDFHEELRLGDAATALGRLGPAARSAVPRLLEGFERSYANNPTATFRQEAIETLAAIRQR